MMNNKRYRQEDFDKIVDRVGTDCIKWDGRLNVFGKADVLPLWVADMDFETPAFIRQRIARRLEHPILGYTYRGDEFASSFAEWVKRRHDWEIDTTWLTNMPGVVSAVSIAVLAFTQPGDEVIIQPPVYHPFYFCVEGHGRKLILNHLATKDGQFTFDLDLLKRQITPKTRMLILSNPHNPGGTVWTPEELKGLVAICKEHDIRILSDEIHSDLIYSPNKHTPLLKIAGDYQNRIILAMAPSKTFNLAALSTSVVVIPDAESRKQFEKLVYILHVGLGNIFGFEAMKAAYEEGDQWLEQLLIYLKGNRDFIRDFIQTEIPVVEMMVPEATYMTWLDFRKLHLTPEELKKFIIEKAGLGLNAGTDFGPGGEGFMRLNFGCPRSLVEKGLSQLSRAIHAL